MEKKESDKIIDILKDILVVLTETRKDNDYQLRRIATRIEEINK